MINTDADFYPFTTQDEYLASIDTLRKSTNWEMMYDKNKMQIFKRK